MAEVDGSMPGDTEQPHKPEPGTRYTHDDGRVCVWQRRGGWGITVEVPEWGLPAKGFCARPHEEPPAPGQGDAPATAGAKLSESEMSLLRASVSPLQLPTDHVALIEQILTTREDTVEAAVRQAAETAINSVYGTDDRHAYMAMKIADTAVRGTPLPWKYQAPRTPPAAPQPHDAPAPAQVRLSDDELAACIADPGSVVGAKHPDETVTRWGVRAIRHTLDKKRKGL